MRYSRPSPRTKDYWLLVIAFLILQSAGLAGTGVFAATPEPSIAYVYPAGAQTGTEATITVCGQYLRGSVAIISGAGIKTAVSGYIGGGGPLSKLQQEELAQYLKARKTNIGNSIQPAVPDLPNLPLLQGLERKSADELKAIYDLYLNNNFKLAVPMNEFLTITVTIDRSAPEGNRELRLAGPQGLTNPVVFQIGHIAETRENGPYEIPSPARKNGGALPTVLNGQIMSGSVDLWDIALKKNESVLAVCQARNLIPYIADAVPGWFQPIIAVQDAQGRELARADDFLSDPDPRLAFTAPADGIYSFVVRDSIYRGRSDFVYRLVIGTKAEVMKQLPVPSSLGIGWTASNAKLKSDGRLKVGAKVQGLISEAGEIDSYLIDCSAGETLRISVNARKTGSPLDSVISLYDPSLAHVGTNDDFEDKTLGLFPHHADSLLLATATVSGSYRLDIRDASALGGSDYRYELNVERPQPDFAVITQKSGITLRQTGSASFTVQAIRRDGWKGDLEVYIENAPAGFSLEGGIIPAGQDIQQITITASATAQTGLAEISLAVRGLIDGREATRKVSAADLRMQAFGNTHLVQAESLHLLVLKKTAKR